ncbi:MAG TPA: CRTAC1 family protein [Thermoleophilaceae bacterium]
MNSHATPRSRTSVGRRLLPALAAVAALWLVPSAGAQTGSVTFRDVAAGDGAGISYRRGPGADEAKADAAYRKVPYTMQQLAMETPPMPRLVGVAVLDYDNDGHPDILAANGPAERGETGPGVSLYRNLLGETGDLTFSDVSSEAGLKGPTRKLNVDGVAYADVDNDGCEEILLTGDNDVNKLFHQKRAGSRCSGRFEDVSGRSGLGVGGHHTSASFGDVNADGLVDVVIAEGWHRQNAMACMAFSESGEGIRHSRLYLNRGKLRFRDVSRESGIWGTKWFHDSKGPRPDLDGLPTITWAASIVDYNGDGLQDVLLGEDQCFLRPSKYQELFPELKLADRGFIRVFRNSGNGKFTDATRQARMDVTGSWMGFSLADFDFDSRLDLFATNVGDYMVGATHNWPYHLGEYASRPFYGAGETFADRGVGDRVKASTFGWGTSTIDYDNDGCTDVVYVGGLDIPTLVERSNPGTLLRNVCGGEAGRFETDQASYPPTDDKIRNQHMGLATADLDGNGAQDLVEVSAERIPDYVPARAYDDVWGAPSDAAAAYFVRMVPSDPKRPLWPATRSDYNTPEQWTFAGWSAEPGRLSVEVNSGNSNNWVKVRTVGARGTIKAGRVNRDGIGALVRVTPAGGRPASVPVLGGSSFLSQHDRTLGFGLGSSHAATVEVVWPNGVRNRLYGVNASETVVFPEIPCAFQRRVRDRRRYVRCVTRALAAEQKARLIGREERVRFKRSALRAYDEANAPRPAH